jgi:hypothetical protein
VKPAAILIERALFFKEFDFACVDRKLFIQFTLETLFERFLCFDFPSGKFPFESVPAFALALTKKDASVPANNSCGDFDH